MTQSPEHYGIWLGCLSSLDAAQVQRLPWTNSLSLDRCQVLGEGPGHQDDFTGNVYTSLSILILILTNCAKQMWLRHKPSALRGKRGNRMAMGSFST